MDSPEIMLKPLLAADCMPKKVHRVFHEKVTGLGKIHKYQPKNWSLETTHVETLGCHLILPSKARLHSHFSGWSTEHHLPNSEISGDKQSKLEGNRRKMEEGKGTPGSYLHTDSFTSFKILRHPIPSAKNSCRYSHVGNRASEGHRTASLPVFHKVWGTSWCSVDVGLAKGFQHSDTNHTYAWSAARYTAESVFPFLKFYNSLLLLVKISRQPGQHNLFNKYLQSPEWVFICNTYYSQTFSLNKQTGFPSILHPYWTEKKILFQRGVIHTSLATVIKKSGSHKTVNRRLSLLWRNCLLLENLRRVNPSD